MTYLKDRFNACAATVGTRTKIACEREYPSESLSYLWDSHSRCPFTAQFRKNKKSYAPLYTTTSRFVSVYGWVYLCFAAIEIVCLCVACGFALDFYKLFRSFQSPRVKRHGQHSLIVITILWPHDHHHHHHHHDLFWAKRRGHRKLQQHGALSPKGSGPVIFTFIAKLCTLFCSVFRYFYLQAHLFHE